MAITSVETVYEYDAAKARSGAPHYLTALVLKLIGSAFLCAALGMWLLPGGSWDADVAFIKIGITVFFALTGASFISAASGRS